ncbi:hypothetical protein WJX72_005610 [[Myrmecia] bisecta]|uniref:Nucleolar protein 14 n=1 Tax=[Myrmecia] bisecta TaxID=41462 RepID=A0AAW1Q5P6_9CHLO
MYVKKKFDVLGKKVKGQQRPTGKARSDAVEKRKKTLLVEYKQLRKSNNFIDRRFGEDDDTLTEEEKAIARFQKQRMTELAGSKFALADDDEEEPLTHMGRSLAELDHTAGRGVSFPDHGDDDDGQLGEDLVNELHFGGGFVRKAGGGPDAGLPERHRTKKEIMEEVMAKSKAYKAEKQQQREEDLTATEALDQDFKQLVQAGGLARLVRPKGAKGDKSLDAKAAPEDAAYDRMRRELVFEAKAKVGERTKTPEEIAEEERQRLEALEHQRLKRMRAGLSATGDDDADEFAEEPGKGGGFAGRRKRQKLDPGAAAAKNRTDASGDALEDDFIMDDDQEGDDDDEGDEGSEGSDEPDGPAGALQKRQMQRAAGDHPLQSGFRMASAQLLAKYGVEPGAKTLEELEEQEWDEDASGSEEESRSESGDASLSADIAYVLPAPDSYPEFAAVVEGRSAQDLKLIVQRIRACNAVALATDNRRKMQVLYGLLVQHFVMLADSSPLPTAHLDAMTVHILEMTPEVPFYAATVARARLTRLQQRLAAALRDPFAVAGAWPGPRALMLLKLWATVFPVSDRRHPVATPAALLASAYLALCTVTSRADIAQGLFLSSLALHMAAPAKRLVPEPLTFAVSLLSSAIPQPATSAAARDADKAAFETLEFRASALMAAVGVVRRAAEVFGHVAAAPELFAAAERRLAQLSTVEHLPVAIRERVVEVLRSLTAARESAVAARRPLVKHAHKRPDFKLFNPRFEEDFATGKDYDPDRDRADTKRLKREISKEKRGAMRELRKDAVFLGEEREGEKAAARAERGAVLRGNMAFLQQQEADFKSGGQGGMWKKKKKK